MKRLLVTVLLGLALSPAALGSPTSKHIWIITQENHSFEEIVGSSQMPYFNNLIRSGALATQYYSNVHSSLWAWMNLVTGSTIAPATNPTVCYGLDNLVRHMMPHGLTWKSYNEDLPYAGSLISSSANYVRGHNPLSSFSDTCPYSQRYNSAPEWQLYDDMSNHTLPNFVYQDPNLMNDGHSGGLAREDAWLSYWIPKVLSNPQFRPGGDGQLWIVWDEGNLTWDWRCGGGRSGCGGRVVTLVIGPQVKKGYRSTVLYHQQNILKTWCNSLGISCPGAGAWAGPMNDLFWR